MAAAAILWTGAPPGGTVISSWREAQVREINGCPNVGSR